MLTFCIPSKNNLRYLKSCIESIRSNSTTKNDIVVYVDADNDGTEIWLKDNGIRYIKNDTQKPRGISYGYNRCIEAANTDIVCTFHADMYMAKGFDVAILKYLKHNTVVSATRIEPPLHPKASEKIIEDFGMYPEDFNKAGFDDYVIKSLEHYKNKTTNGIFAPWACYKKDVISIGIHDEDFHSYHEDSDIFNRFILNGYEVIQTWEAFVYHLTCRGGQFQDGIEKVTSDEAFHKMRNGAMKHYLRKWGSWIKNDEYQHPIISSKYNVAFIVRNCNLQMLEILEPWCDTIYIDDDMQVITIAYLEKEQKDTVFDLSKRVLPITINDPFSDNDIVVEFDAKLLNNQNFQLIQQLSDIIKDSGEVGKFELDIFTVTINNMTTYENKLINLTDEYYTSKLIKL